MELTTANLEYIKLALDEGFEELPEALKAYNEPKAGKKRDLVSTDQHTCKIYKATEGEKVTIFTSVKDPNHKTKYKTARKTIKLSEDPEFNQSAEQLAIDEVEQKGIALAANFHVSEEESGKNEE